MMKFYTFLIAAGLGLAANAVPPAPLQMQAASVAAKAAASDADYTEWTSLGTATVDESTYLDNLEFTLNSYRYESEEEIAFARTSEVFTRQLKSDPAKQQFKFTKFLGYNDLIADFDESNSMLTVAKTPTGMPVPSGLAEWYGCTSIDFSCNSATYSRARKIFTFSRAFFIIYDDMGLMCENFTLSLPDARPDIQILFNKVSGGLKSTDRSYTLGLDLTEIDHVRYITRHDASLTYNDVADINSGSIEYKESADSIRIEFDKGYGAYRVLALAYDADDKYMGLYNTVSLFSNLAPEGIWEPVGRGIWHHPDIPFYIVFDFETNEGTQIDFPADALQWEVDIEKRTDTDRQIYRVVNPYNPTCGIADTFNSTLDLMYGDAPEYRPEAFATDDTYWFVFDVTTPGNITFEENRPNGVGTANFMSTSFYSQNRNYSSEATFIDNTLIIPDYNYTHLQIDLPATQGIADVEVENAPVEYYNLQGVRIDNPSAGVYIRRQGTTATKIHIK